MNEIKQLLDKDQFDSIILDCLEQKLSFSTTLNKIKSLTTVLSEYDIVYLGKQYSERLIELWCTEASENVDLSNPKQFQPVLSALSSIQNFQECSSLIGKSTYHDLVCDFTKQSGFLKKQESKCIDQFKRACLNRIQQHTVSVKSEISFLTHLGQLLKLSKNPHNECDELQLTELVVNRACNEVSLRQLLSHLQTINSNDKEILGLKSLACKLLGVSNYYLINDLKETVCSYLKEVTVNKLSVDGREVLEVSGTHIVVSKVLPRIESQPRFSQIDEVRFVNSEVVHVDTDLVHSNWHGKNIVLYSKSLIVGINRLYCWDVSGRNGAEPQRELVHRELSGADGNDGESGGNVLIIADNLINGENLIIISNGGNGANGQDGMSGKKGKDGESLSNEEFELRYPPVSKYRDSEKRSCLRTTYDNVVDGLSTVEDLHYVGLPRFGPIQKDTFKQFLDMHVNDITSIYFEVTKTNGCKITFSFYNRPLVPFSNCYSFLLLKGSPGSEGEAGGRGGKGGNTGFPGDINIHINQSNDKCIKIFQEGGVPGEDGKWGNNGVCGKSGLDYAYMDISSTTTKWPVMFLPSEHDSITLKVEYKHEDTGNCVYTLRGLYAEITRCEKDVKKSGTANIDIAKLNCHATSSRTQASRKKTISLQDTLNSYRQNITTANLFELNFYIEKTEQMIDVNIDETLSQATEEITVKRASSESSKLNVPRFWFINELTASIDDILLPEIPIKDVNTLLTLVEKDPNNILNWTNLVQVKMDFGQLKHLWNVFMSLKVGKNDGPLLKEYVKNLLCNKLELSIIEEFDMQPLISMSRESFHNAEDVELVINQTVNATESLCNSPSLRYEVLKFFCEDSMDRRYQVKSILKSYKSDILPREILKTCAVELNGSCDASKGFKILFKNNTVFERKKSYDINQKFCTLKHILMTSKDIRLHQMLLDGVVNMDRNKLFEVDRALTFSSDVLLNIIHATYCNALRRDFDWVDIENSCFRFRKTALNIEMVIDLFDKVIAENGPFSKCCREILAYHFKTNIIIYSKSEFHNKIEIVNNHNPQAVEKINLLMNDKKFLHLNIDNGFLNWINTLKGAGKLYSILLCNIGSLTELHQFYDLRLKPFILKDYDGIDRSRSIKVKIKHILTEDDDLKLIKDRLFGEEDKIILGPRLEKLKMEFIGYVSIIHFMALHFKEEGNTTTGTELAAIINFIMKSSTDDPYLLPVISWIVAAHPQTRWLIEIVLLKLAHYFKKELDCDLLQNWRIYFSKLKVRDGLVLLCEKISSCSEKNSLLSVEQLEEVFYLMSRTPKSHIGLNDIDIGEWKYYLKDKYWMYQLSTVADWTVIQLNSMTYFLSSLENSFGMKTCQKLLDLLSNCHNPTPSEKNQIENIFRELALAEVEIDEQLMNSLSRVPVFQWKEVVKQHQKLGEERNVAQLLKLIKESGNTSTNIQSRLGEFEEFLELTNTLIEKLAEHIKTLTDLKLWVSILLECIHARKGSTSILSKITFLIPNFIAGYSSKLSRFFKSIFKQVPLTGGYLTLLNECFDTLGVNRSSPDEHQMLNYMLIATVFLAIRICKQIKLRETQKLAILMFLRSDTDILGQVSTGEGKSLIVLSVAIIKVLLLNHSVDVITSSHVLARRDALEYKDVYEVFNVSVGHNCCDEIEERKKNYSGCQIVYGELANFQRDYLLDRFYDKNVMGDRKFQSVIVDEVDSMLMDQSSNMLYLSHDIPDLDKLEPLFVYIWKWLNMPGKLNQQIPSPQHLKESILFDIFGWLNKDQIINLDTSISDEQVYFTWERLISEGFINEKGQLLKQNIEDGSFEDNTWSNCIHKEHLTYLMKKLVERDKQIEVPNHLKHFVLTHLDKWIKSAFEAISMNTNCDYVVDIDRSSSNPDCNPNIIILDRDTGTDLTNSHWDGGLHQFLQLKHGCRLSLLSLKAVFRSNVSYLKFYETLYGLTGTLGSPRERDLLKEVYNVNFVTIPTSKPKIFVEYPPLICSTTAEWMDTIVYNVFDVSQNRSALVICESVNDVMKLEQAFNEILNSQEGGRKIVTYKRDYEELQVADRLEPGYIILSTNLAGRGTDIKLSQGLISAGGLHVCLTFLPTNRRIEEQAYGRVSRNGVPGSAQIIFLNHNPSITNVINIKKLRDDNEYLRLVERKEVYENKIKVEEEKFDEFKTAYESLKKMTQPIEVKTLLLQECINQWAFWLDDNLKNKSGTPIRSFLNNITNLGNNDFKKLLEMVKNPSILIRLGMFYIKDKQFKNAISVLNKVITNEPHFSGIARYYRILAESKETDLNNDYVVNELQLSKKQLDHRIDSLLINMEIVDRLKLHDPQSNLQYDSFKEQQENIIKMYLVFADTIDKIIGPKIDKIFLDNEHILHDLIKDEYVIHLQISSSLVIEELSFVKDYGLDPKEVFTFLKSVKGSREFNLDNFVVTCPLPSRELFWNELVSNSILIDEHEYIMIDAKKLSNVDPSLKQRIETLAVKVDPDARNQVWLYREEEIKDTFGQSLFDTKVFLMKAGENKMKKLEEQNIIRTNKRATLISVSEANPPLSFTSISIEEFCRVGIGINTAQSILRELTEMKILRENNIDGKQSFSMMININDLRFLKLSNYKNYSMDVKNLLVFHFAFHFALKKLIYQLYQGKILTVPMQIMPHNRIVSNLVEREIIKSVLNKEKCLDELLTIEMDEAGWKTMFTKHYDELESNTITRYLIADSNCLERIPWSFKHHPFLNGEKYQVKTDENGIINFCLPETGKNEILERDYKTIKVLIQQREHMKSLMNEAKGSIMTIKTAGFSLTPFEDILKKNDLSTTEMNIFSLNGFDKVLSLGEKKWSGNMKFCAFITTMIGVAQIGAGAALALTAVGLPLSEVLISDGISDLVFSFTCYATGLFSWTSYLMNKVMSVASSFAACLSKIFSSSFGKKTLTLLALETTETTASLVTESVTKAVLGKEEIIKTISARVIKSVGIGVVCNTLPNLIDPHCEKISNFLLALFNSHIDEVLNRHAIVGRIELLYSNFEKKQCKQMVQHAISKSLSGNKRNICWDETILKAIRILFGAISTIQELNLQFCEPQVCNLISATCSLGMLGRNVMEAIVSAKEGKFNDIFGIITMLIDDVDRTLCTIIQSENLDQLDSVEESNSSQSSKEIRKLIDLVKDDLSCFIKEKIVSPFLCLLSECILKQYNTSFLAGNGLSKLRFPEPNRLENINAPYLSKVEEHYDELIKIKEEELSTNKTGFEDKLSQNYQYLNLEYDHCLLEMFRQRGNCDVFAEIVEKNLRVDSFYLKLCCIVIPAFLKSHDIHLPGLEIILHQNGSNERYCSTLCRKSELTTVNMIHDGNVESPSNQNTFLIQDVFEATRKVIVKNYPEFTWNPKKMLTEILYAIKNDVKIRELICIYHEERMKKKYHQKPKLPPQHVNLLCEYPHCKGKWKLNSSLDVDLRHAFDSRDHPANRTASHIKTGFCAALTKVNSHIYKVQSHLKQPFKLNLEDFDMTEIDIIPPISWPPKTPFECQFNHYELNVPFKVNEFNQMVDFNISLSLKNNREYCQPHSPQGPHILYEIKPVQYQIRYIGLGVKGYVLLNSDCNNLDYSADSCHIAGELILPSNSKLPLKKKEIKVIVFGDSLLNFISEYINRPLCEVFISEDIIETSTKTGIQCIPSCYTGISCVVLHLGKVLLLKKPVAEIVIIVKKMVQQLNIHFKNINIVIYGMHMLKNTPQFKLARNMNTKIVKLNSEINSFCTLERIVFIDSNDFIMPNDLRINGVDLNRRGLMLLGRHIANLI